MIFTGWLHSLGKENDMRLIDADELFPYGSVFIVDDKKPMKTISELLNKICNAPTAYDVEKDVSELEKKKETYKYLYTNCEDNLVAAYDLGRYDGILKAIEIIRKGGIDG